MAEFIFTSPTVKFRERDLTFITRSVGLTHLGLVGETEKGPAFEPVACQDRLQFKKRFGGQNTKKFPNGSLQYHLPYVANAYLKESSQLYVTRVLGLSGYDAGTAWAITLSAGVDESTITTGSTVTNSGVAFEDGIYLGVAIYITGQTGQTFDGFTKTNGTFTGEQHNFTVVTYDATTGEGTVNDDVTTITAQPYAEYENMVLAVIRSRGRVTDKVNDNALTTFDATQVEITGNTTVVGVGDLFGQFTVVASNANHLDVDGNVVPGTPESYVVSLNPSAAEYLPSVLGRKGKDKNTKLWVEAIYPDLIKKLDADGVAYGINTELIVEDSELFTNRKTQFKTPETPWVVSQLRGNKVDRLFRFISISDGESANHEIKISIANINPVNGEFDLYVRDFYDTDDNISVLESFTRCSVIREHAGFIGNKIGTVDGDYALRSEYVMIELAEDISADSYPAGFEGYWFNQYSGDAIPPQIYYKTTYLNSERPQRVYLGVSPSGYDGVGLVGKGVNQNYFNFNGWMGSSENFVKSRGFHMDSNATGTYYHGTELIGEFDLPNYVDTFGNSIDSGFQLNDVLSPDSPYFELNTRKFSFVPAGGFDGWDIHRNGRSNTDLYRKGGIYDGVDQYETPENDFQAWETAINTFSNPEKIFINLFATPGINWSDHNLLVRESIEMVEKKRTDSLYIIDSPDFNIPQLIGNERGDILAAKGIADLLDSSELDSSYACTYFPWIKIRDTQNGNVTVHIPPTGEVVAAMAFTDKAKFPWFAPAGLQRGVTNARGSKYRLSLEARDILYKNRINPMAEFADVGTAIFGQKTLQMRESALDRINVRRLLLQIKVLISNIAVRLLFDQNDSAVVDEFLAKTNPILDNIKRERGLYDFRIKMDDTINSPETRDRNELYGEISLKPTRSLEFIGITFTITPSGASFDDV
jgi:hypothetical protein